MTYQPPLWGTKQLLNFTAYSYPDIGGYIVLIAGVLIVLIAVWEMFSKVNLHPRVLNKKVAWAHVILILFLFNSCSSGPDPLKFGIDGCDYCKMIIMNDRYGAEAITKKGKVYKFDSIECMANYIKEHPGENNYANLLTLDYMQPGKFIDAKNAVFVLSEDLPSPMGLNLTSFQTEDAVNTLRNKVDGKMLKWEEVTQLVAEEI